MLFLVGLAVGLDSFLLRRRAAKAKFTAPFFQCSFDGGGEIQEQMKPIGHLDGMGGSLFGGLGINSTTIPSDHFYARMLFQPNLQTSHRTVRKEVDDVMLIQVHQNRSIILPLAPGPVVYAKVSDWIAVGSVARSLNHPNHRIVV